MIEYRAVREADLNTLSFSVEDLIKDGWKPEGGIAVDFDVVSEDRFSGKLELCGKQYIQVMTREEVK